MEKRGRVPGNRMNPLIGFPLLFSCLILLTTAPRLAWADGILDVGPQISSAGQYLFPNWVRSHVGQFALFECADADCPCASGPINALTIMNYGTAIGGAGGDISAVYFQIKCGGTTTALFTMSYAGTYQSDSGPAPAWTWAGSAAFGDACSNCLCTAALSVYADVASCPTPGRTVQLGPGTNNFVGGISDTCGYSAPWQVNRDPFRRYIEYAVKVGDKDYVAPGDTVRYSVYYGKPGIAALSNVIVMDTQPPYTHYVFGSAAPAPDLFWDPNLGPPLRLRWTIGGPMAVTGGPTQQVSFSLSVDWGNGDAFESGSGNVAAPEGVRLNNRAQVFYPDSTCALKTAVTSLATTVVRRFMMWKIGDNDMLFSSVIGRSADEMIYEIFLKNMSDSRTWWAVTVWDSVPPSLDSWAPDCGFEDPCTGWTMTPSGCASASPGKSMSGASTVLSWKLDMPPRMTLTLRWKAKVVPTTQAGETAINKACVMAMGHSGIVGGTGHSGVPRNFTHLARYFLPTTYVSYVAYAGGADDGVCPGFGIYFWPMHKSTQFELRGLGYQGAGWATTGGVSASIGCPVGNCLGGFPGTGGNCPGAPICGGGVAGCKAERSPARYEPTCWMGTCPTYPWEEVFKLVSNSPVLWQTLAIPSDKNDDTITYAPSTTMSYTGMMHYLWRRWDPDSGASGGDFGDSLLVISTGKNSNETYDPDLATTVHLFQWDSSSLSWSYRKTYELAGESEAYDMGTAFDDQESWRIISSDTHLIIHQGYNIPEELGIYGQGSDNHGHYAPIRETGNSVSQVGSGTFYFPVSGRSGAAKVAIGNTGVADARYRISRYVPDNMAASGNMPPSLNGTSGSWVSLVEHDVPAGFANPDNPRRYNTYGSLFDIGGTFALYKVEVLSGGPIQILSGFDIYNHWSGGSVIHAADGNQTGIQFWFHHTGWATDTYTQTLSVFCPKNGMAIRCLAEGGYSATYTTTGLDQCVSFRAVSSISGSKRNYVIDVLPNPAQGKVIAQYIQLKITEKGFTAPFLSTGTHYRIIAPPIVFAGQSFWITLVVIETGGTTKTDYTGTTSFSSTDPAAKIQGAAMDGYNYTWNGCGTNCGVKVFVNVSLMQMGLQSIVAIDTMDGSITGITAVMVVGADIKLEKRRKLTIAASGDTVQFQICWSNFSSATGFSFTITDAVPMGTTYVPEIASTMLCQASTPVPGMVVWYSTATSTTPPGTFTSLPGTSSPLSNTRWLRWTIQDVYVNSTGCVCFKVSVN